MEAKAKLKSIRTRKRLVGFDKRAHGTMVNTDMKRLQQVILNLYSNAIKFSNRKGKITIQVESVSDEKLMVKVIDNGQGIRKKDKHKLFTMFGSIKENNPQGIGLGLCICQQIVLKFGGQINFLSKRKKNTVFYFTFETVKTEQVEILLSSEDIEKEAIQQKIKIASGLDLEEEQRVMVVDDDQFCITAA